MDLSNYTIKQIEDRVKDLEQSDEFRSQDKIDPVNDELDQLRGHLDLRRKLQEPHKEVIHDVKCIEPFFSQCKHGFKPFEVRKDDRNYQVGDFLRQHKYDQLANSYAKEEPIIGRITYKLDGGQFGIEKGYCVLGIDYTSILSKPNDVKVKY